MATITVSGRITKTGKLKVELPPGLPPGEVDVTIQIRGSQKTAEEIPWEERPWTEEEIRELLSFNPRPLAEIIKSDLGEGWEDMGITDSVQWVEELRRKQERRQTW